MRALRSGGEWEEARMDFQSEKGRSLGRNMDLEEEESAMSLKGDGGGSAWSWRRNSEPTRPTPMTASWMGRWGGITGDVDECSSYIYIYIYIYKTPTLYLTNTS